jgi:hypothetical protein
LLSSHPAQLLEGAQLLADLIASYEQSFDQQQQQAGGVDADFSGGWVMAAGLVGHGAEGAACLPACLPAYQTSPDACLQAR